ncbi:unnamed protein product [Didymodactylos carnosus]|uniref:EF-hand domain-containing protein n=1 Tax=Didymodactylos carnosus TaxID=1234261 RepID=A0A814XAN0_9BILA|nr:unnamed protein product [Didymodactylos carnosus]CAF1213208.1 unnamed protein product [Didymodactylos carnosus]CAF3722207.1 unnamed protein product [Didymodactylos carnosus]CAF3977193.1 unnamed protein product [Didymodactylos carnosus]
MTDYSHTTKEKIEFVRAVEEAFFILDRNKSRSVGRDDFVHVANSIDLDAQESLDLLRTAIEEQTDDEHSSELNISEYCDLMLRHVSSSDLDLELKLTFKYFDRDHDGLITQEDLDKLIEFFNFNDEEYQQVRQWLTEKGMNYQQFVEFMMHD